MYSCPQIWELQSSFAKFSKCPKCPKNLPKFTIRWSVVFNTASLDTDFKECVFLKYISPK